MASIDTIVEVAGANGRTTWMRVPAGQKAPKGARYRVRYRTPDGKSRSKTVTRKLDAERFLATVEGRKLDGTFVDPMAGRLPFAVYAAGWLDRKRATLKPTTVATWASHLAAHITPAFGHLELREISRESVKAWALQLGTTVKPTTARAVVFTLAAILREAVDDDRIVKNPAERIQAGAKTERRVDPMRVGTVAAKVPALAEAMPDRWRAAVLLMASTGLRLGECLGLTVDRVDFLRSTIRVDRQIVALPGSFGFGTPKTRAGVRRIPVPRAVVEMLAAHLAEFPPGVDGLIFTMPPTRENRRGGGPVTRNRLADAYRAAVAAVELPKGTRTHDLRHVAASALIASGLSVAAVQAVLGHSSPAETLDVYTHLWPADEERTRQAIEAATASWARAIR